MRFGVIFKLVFGFTILLIFLMSMLIVSNTYIVQKSIINEFRNVANSISRNMSIQAATLYKVNQLDLVEETFKTYGEYYPNIWFRINYTEHPEKSFTYGNRENQNHLLIMIVIA